MNKKFWIITHCDLDGGSSAICIINYIKQKYGRNSEIKLAFKTYKNINEFVERILETADQYEKIFISDISVSEYIADGFPDNIILLDHHDTAKNLIKYKNCIVDVSGKECGASLCYYHLLKKEGFKYDHLTQLVAITRTYDLWINNSLTHVSKNLNFIFYDYWGDKFCERFENGFDGFNDYEKKFLKERWDGVLRQQKEAVLIDLLDNEVNKKLKNKLCLYITEEKHLKSGDNNELCDYVLNTLNYEAIICVIPRRNQLSIRIKPTLAEKGIHVGKLCEEFHKVYEYTSNGGGHAAAGGAHYEDENKLELLCDKFAEKICPFII